MIECLALSGMRSLESCGKKKYIPSNHVPIRKEYNLQNITKHDKALSSVSIHFMEVYLRYWKIT